MKLRYHPALDGMRFFGILSVLCAHASRYQPKLARFGCFMFVDMFFVISGYLITALLLREYGQNRRVNLRAFYVRRFARLYPLILAILAIGIVQQVGWPDSTATPSWIAIVGIALYFFNFVQIFHRVDLATCWSPLWSLSIEEQFYAVWPITLLVVVGRKIRLHLALLLVTGLTIAIWVGRSWSAYAAWSTPLSSPTRTYNILVTWNKFYFSTFQRPDGLLIGCAAALLLAKPESRLTRFVIALAHRLRAAVIIGILAIVVATQSEHAPWQIYWGLGAFNICVALLTIEITARPESRIVRAMGFRPFAWVGRRTYFIYAVHLAAFGIMFNVIGWTTLPAIILLTLFIVALAGVSYRYYEDPIRRWGYRLSNRLIARGATD